MKTQSIILRFQIAGDAKDSLERQATRHGMTQTQLASRLVGWLVQQPQTVLAAVLNNIAPGVNDDVSRVLLSGISTGKVAAEAKRPARARK